VYHRGLPGIEPDRRLIMGRFFGGSLFVLEKLFDCQRAVFIRLRQAIQHIPDKILLDKSCYQANSLDEGGDIPKR